MKTTLGIAAISAATLAATAMSSTAVSAQETGDGSLSRAQFIAQMDAQFTQLDADQNGIITDAEIGQRRVQLQQAAALRLNQQIFQQLDTDGNGALSPQEFAALSNPNAVGAVPVPSVQEFDRDGDGAITLVEYRIRTQGNFDALDQDRDGIMSAAEMQAAGLPAS
ncbi:EF-hand domain-containing protein [Qipengyuania sp. DSG2-2]|uniref:EF-hand domain-containing protein n=1 Tax=Qipengyuania sp. DGS2-2 TaxID=3349631 RepID=UPI0036D285CD